MRTVALAILVAGAVPAQDFSQRGFLDVRSIYYPQTASHDRGRVVGESLLRYEASCKLGGSLRFSGAIDARADSHQQTERAWRFDTKDWGLERPAFSLRRLSATWHRGPFTAEIGKQFIRWGKADILNPTDRFAPRDYLAVVDNDFLAVPAARLTIEGGSETLDLVYSPRFTPSRMPLINQRWTVLPEAAEGVRLFDLGSRRPGGPQFGARWNHVGRGFEHSLSFYEGYNHLPLFDIRLTPPGVSFQRFYPKLRMWGADAAVPIRWLTLKGEAAYLTSRTLQADEYVLYVVQLERQAGEWLFVGGYSGEHVTSRRRPIDFAPDRGLTRAFLGRAAYTIDTRRSVAMEAAVRRNGEGTWVKWEYSHLMGAHWRATLGFTLVRGDVNDFLGQYRRNSHALLALRYSF